jgi:hypothetical protein
MSRLLISYEFRPGISPDRRQRGRALPHHVELAIGLDFANGHWLGDVLATGM